MNAPKPPPGLCGRELFALATLVCALLAAALFAH